MIPYKVYEKYLQIAFFFFKVFQSTLIHSTVPMHWRVAAEVYTPKKNPPNPELIEDF